GGSVRVDASEWVEIQGENGGVSARTRGSGNAGDVSITTPRLIIGSQGSATVESLGTGDAGDLQISSDYIDLNQGRITGETTSGQGGNLTITGRDIRLLNNSQISTTAGTEDQPGDGGNITITTDTLVGLQNSDITANSFRGRGGQINITAEGIFGLEVREELTPNNDITAFSLFDPSLNGEVNLRTPDIDPTQGLTDVPTIESPEQVTEVCPERADNEGNELTTAGRGLPTDPTAPLGDSEILVEPIAPVTETGEGINSSPPVETPSREVLVAQDWYVNEQGQLILTETATNFSPRSSWEFPVRCPNWP
ncbi:S-layer family protein, partial [Spirulina sp. CS-785/01]